MRMFHTPPRRRLGQFLHLLVGERLQLKAHRPGRTTLRQLRPRHAEQQNRLTSGKQRDVLDQVQERLLAVMDVVEHDDERLRPCRLLERLADRPRELLGADPCVALAQERPDRRRDPRVVGNEPKLLQDLDHGPVRDPVPVRQAAALNRRRLDIPQRLGDQPRLPDPCLADDRHQLAAPVVTYPPPRLAHERQLALAADKGKLVSTLRRIANAEQPQSLHGLGFPLDLQRLHVLDDGGPLHECERLLADQDLARPCRLLEPRRHVHRVTYRKPLAGAAHDLAAVDADPRRHTKLRHRRLHLERGAHRP
jgi:hypothetical protein